MISIYQNLHHERQYTSSTGLKKQAFENLLIVFKKYFKAKEQPIKGCQKPVLTDAGEALFFILYYLKTGLTHQVLGMSFGISSGTTTGTYISYLKSVLLTTLNELEQVPKTLFANEEKFNQVFEGVEEVFVDVTEIAVPRAEYDDIQRDFYSGKKTSHSKIFNF